jgi:uncharacterized membrane protein YqjE
MTQDPEPVSPAPPTWREAVVEFISARAELFSLEAKEAGAFFGKKAVLAVVIAFCALVAWLAIVAGLIGWVASAGVAWYFAALGAAALHLLVAGIAALLLRRPAPPAFSHTKAELAKDREWLLNKDKISKR